MSAAADLEKRLRKWGYELKVDSFPDVGSTDIYIVGSDLLIQVEEDVSRPYALARWERDPESDDDINVAIQGSYDTEEQLVAALRLRLPTEVKR